MVSLALDADVCPLCIVQYLMAATSDIVVPTPHCNLTYEALKIFEGGNRTLEALARAHNREMHAMNGNINFTIAHTTERPDEMAASLARATRPIRHRHVVQAETDRKLRVIQEEILMLVYSSTTANGVGFVHWYYDTLGEPSTGCSHRDRQDAGRISTSPVISLGDESFQGVGICIRAPINIPTT